MDEQLPNTRADEPPLTAAGQASRNHRRALLLFVAIAALFLVLTGMVSLPVPMLWFLYTVLAASAAYLMWTTMSVMINRHRDRGDS